MQYCFTLVCRSEYLSKIFHTFGSAFFILFSDSFSDISVNRTITKYRQYIRFYSLSGDETFSHTRIPSQKNFFFYFPIICWSSKTLWTEYLRPLNEKERSIERETKSSCTWKENMLITYKTMRKWFESSARSRDEFRDAESLYGPAERREIKCKSKRLNRYLRFYLDATRWS